MRHWLRSRLQPTPPPYDPYEWRALPLPERARRSCQSWAEQGFGAPFSVYVFYALKAAAYVLMWAWFCSLSPSLGGPSTISQWWLQPLALQKMVLWSMLFELLGLGCGSGPLTARYLPPFGGAPYFLRWGTLKRAPWPNAPLIGGAKRGPLEVSLYAALVCALGAALVSEAPETSQLLLIVTLLPALGLLDQSIVLIARAEHYWVMSLCFYFGAGRPALWLSGLMVVQLALWFWAGVSKLNPHFPSVITVMLSNHPLNRSRRFRRALYRGFPEDLQPSSLARLLAHIGASLELLTPLLLGLACSGLLEAEARQLCLLAGVVLGLKLHVFITSSVPMGVPIEWNLMIMYSIFALFWAHPELEPFKQLYLWSPSASAQLPPQLEQGALLSALLLGALIIPLTGNLSPRRVSFLLSMRYYAGNWPYSVWLFKGGAEEKLKALKMSAPWVTQQLGALYDEETVEGVMSRVMGFRLMHLQGRALNSLLPLVTDGPLQQYRYMEGEVLCGLVLGWNFGDGHLHQSGLLRLVQAECGFESGELRCVFVESQPLGVDRMSYELYDAHDGRLRAGYVKVSALLKVQPWEPPPLEDEQAKA